jgi:hypothetical protein
MNLLGFCVRYLVVLTFDGFPEITEKFGLPDALLVHAIHPVVLFVADVGLKIKKN